MRFDYLVLNRVGILTLLGVASLFLSRLVIRLWLREDLVNYALFCLSIFAVKFFDSIGYC